MQSLRYKLTSLDLSENYSKIDYLIKSDTGVITEVIKLTVITKLSHNKVYMQTLTFGTLGIIAQIHTS